MTGLLTANLRHVTDRRGKNARRRTYDELRVSPPYMRDAGFAAGDRLRVRAEPGRIVIEQEDG